MNFNADFISIYLKMFKNNQFNLTIFFCLMLSCFDVETVEAQEDSSLFLVHSINHIGTYARFRNFEMQLGTQRFENSGLGQGFRLRVKQGVLAFSIPTAANSTFTNAELTSYGYNYDYYLRQNSFHFVGRHYWEGENLLDLPKRDDFQFTFMSLTWRHVFNKDYSIRASARMFEQQLHSNGGIVLATDLFYNYLPDELQQETIAQKHLFIPRINIGYTYTYIWKRDYYATIYATTGAAFFTDFKNKNNSQWAFQPLSDINAAIGYQNDSFGVGFFVSNTNNDFESLNISIHNFYIGWLANFRL